METEHSVGTDPTLDSGKTDRERSDSLASSRHVEGIESKNATIGEKRSYLSELIERNYDSHERAFEVSVKYAEMYLKNCFILNGGAILAFPTMSQLSGISVHDHKVGFILSLASLSLGLVTSLIAVAASSAWFNKAMTIYNINVRILRKMINNVDVNIDKIEEYWANSQREGPYKWLKFYARMTILFATISGISFIVGIISGGLVVSEIDLLLLSTGG